MDKYYQLHPKQVDCINLLSQPQIQTVGFGGARGGGKSYLARAYLIIRSLKYPNSKHLIVRRTFPELQRNHIANIKIEYASIGEYRSNTHQFVLNNGSTIELGYCESDSDLERYQGGEYETIVLDECQFQTKKRYEYFNGCLRTSQTSGIVPKMLLTFNPGGIGHSFLKALFIDKHYENNEDPNSFAFLQSLVYDNPSIVDNDPAYVKRLESLPEPIRSAWLKGDFSVFQGQFYQISQKSQIEPFTIQESDARENLYGSLDHGISHYTSFGLWYLHRPKRKFYRLFSYINNGGTAASHAQEIYDRIQSFPYTNGTFPKTIWADPSIWTQARLSERITRAIVDEYKDCFKNSYTLFEKANNSKVNGCALMRSSLSETDGEPQLYYFKNYNSTWHEHVSSVQIDPNNKDICLKMEGDDAADETRYGIVALNSVLNFEAQSQHHNQAIKKIQSNIKQLDWMAI
jgi:phage terminase large subunit